MAFFHALFPGHAPVRGGVFHLGREVVKAVLPREEFCDTRETRSVRRAGEGRRCPKGAGRHAFCLNTTEHSPFFRAPLPPAESRRGRKNGLPPRRVWFPAFGRRAAGRAFCCLRACVPVSGRFLFAFACIQAQLFFLRRLCRKRRPFSFAPSPRLWHGRFCRKGKAFLRACRRRGQILRSSACAAGTGENIPGKRRMLGRAKRQIPIIL